MKKGIILLIVSFVILGMLFIACNMSTIVKKETINSDSNFLNYIQKSHFKYFFDNGDPDSGGAKEVIDSGYIGTGATGMGLMVLVVGAERGFETRNKIAQRVLKILNFFDDTSTDRYHGAWSHFYFGNTGETKPVDSVDDGGDLVESGFFLQGVLTANQYFSNDNTTEIAIRQVSDNIWYGINGSEDVEWDWYMKGPSAPINTTATDDMLSWHWSSTPGIGFKKNMPIKGFDEAMIVFILGMARGMNTTHSTSNKLPLDWYKKVWGAYQGNPTSDYLFAGERYGYKQYVQFAGFKYPPHGYDPGGAIHGLGPWDEDLPLFWIQYSFLGLDPRAINDGLIPAGITYFDVSKNIAMINYEYCLENTYDHLGYGNDFWGLSAGYDPDEYYYPHSPTTLDPKKDNGTITPTAAISSMPFTPKESIDCLKKLYSDYGYGLWTEYGFKGGINLNENWFANTALGIDQAPIVIMIENYRTQLLWKLFMSHPDIQSLMDELEANHGWTVD